MIPIAIHLDTLSLKDITPLNLQADPTIRALIYALDPEFREITQDTKHPLIIPAISSLNDEVLNLLAYQFHADFYDLAATSHLKREAIEGSLKYHMRKGTVNAIKEALRQLDIQAEFIPWWQYGGDPYCFKLDAVVAGDFYRTSGRDCLVYNIVRAVNEAKSARSFMEKLNVEIRDSVTSDPHVTAASFPQMYLQGTIPLQHEKPKESMTLYEGQIAQVEHKFTASLGKFELAKFQSLLMQEANWMTRTGSKKLFHSDHATDFEGTASQTRGLVRNITGSSRLTHGHTPGDDEFQGDIFTGRLRQITGRIPLTYSEPIATDFEDHEYSGAFMQTLTQFTIGAVDDFESESYAGSFMQTQTQLTIGAVDDFESESYAGSFMQTQTQFTIGAVDDFEGESYAGSFMQTQTQFTIGAVDDFESESCAGSFSQIQMKITIHEEE